MHAGYVKAKRIVRHLCNLTVLAGGVVLVVVP